MTVSYSEHTEGRHRHPAADDLHSLSPFFFVFDFAPEDWRVDRIRDHLAFVVGGEWGESPDASDDGVQIVVLRVADISGIDLATQDLTVRRVPESKLLNRLVNRRSVLIEKSGGGESTPVGRAVRCGKVAFPAICSNFMAKADCLPSLSSDFLAYVLDACYSSGLNTAHIQQTTGIQNLRVADYLNLKIAIPAPREQDRIVSFLDATCAAIDCAVNSKKLQFRVLDDLCKQEIQKTVIAGLNHHPTMKETGNTWLPEIPIDWKLVALKRVCNIHTGLTLGKTYEGPVVERPYLRVANVQDGHVDLSSVTMIEVPEAVARSVELQKDDVLMTEGGDLDKLGRGTVWNGEISGCLHQNHIFAIRCMRHKLKPMFLAYLTASKYGRDYFEATGKKTTNLASTNSTKVGLFPIPLPSIGEQEAICSHLKRELARHNELKRCIEKQVDVLVSFRKSLIHECVTGKRRITEEDMKRVQRKAESAIEELAESVA